MYLPDVLMPTLPILPHSASSRAWHTPHCTMPQATAAQLAQQTVAAILGQGIATIAEQLDLVNAAREAAGPPEQLRALLRIPQWDMAQWQQANAAVHIDASGAVSSKGGGTHSFLKPNSGQSRAVPSALPF
jgi:hypothetical protein